MALPSECDTDAFSLSCPPLSAKSAVLIDASSKSVLCEKNARERMGMASTTKIMTALVAAERAELDKTVSVSPSAVGVEGSSIYLYAGEKLTLRDLLCAMLLESANDAAAAIAIEIAGSVEGFCNMMNEKAAELGLCDTHFTNPHGLYDDAHYTTAYDLAMIAAAALENGTVREIVATKKMTLTPIEGNTRVLYNHNKMLSRYEGAIGVKTGFTKKTGRCLVSAAERDGLRLVSVTLNASDDWNDHTRLLDIGFENFCRVQIVKKGDACYMQPLIGGVDEQLPLLACETLYATLPKSIDIKKLTPIVETYNRYAFAPISEGSVAGKMLYYLDGQLVASVPIAAAHEVEKAAGKKSFFEHIKDIFT
jgi:D-alanyl-D-alanine carboxypeptidase